MYQSLELLYVISYVFSFPVGLSVFIFPFCKITLVYGTYVFFCYQECSFFFLTPSRHTCSSSLSSTLLLYGWRFHPFLFSRIGHFHIFFVLQKLLTSILFLSFLLSLKYKATLEKKRTRRRRKPETEEEKTGFELDI
jgi:hypothetical protein